MNNFWLIAIAVIVIIVGIIFLINFYSITDDEVTNTINNFDDDYREWLKKEGIIK